jgi:hypothetical protein
MDRDSSVLIVTRLKAGRLRNRGSILNKSKIIFATPKSSDRLCDTPSRLLNGYRWLFPRVKGT